MHAGSLKNGVPPIDFNHADRIDDPRGPEYNDRINQSGVTQTKIRHGWILAAVTVVRADFTHLPRRSSIDLGLDTYFGTHTEAIGNDALTPDTNPIVPALIIAIQRIVLRSPVGDEYVEITIIVIIRRRIARARCSRWW